VTALNIVLQNDAAHILTDGAGIDAAGRLGCAAHKVVPLPHLGAAVAVNGTRMFLGLVVEAISAGAVSADDLHARIVEILQSAIIPAEPAFTKQFGPHVFAGTVAVAAFSQSKGPHGYLVSTHAGDPNLPSWQRIDVPGMFYSPSNARLNADFSDLNATLDDARGAELVRRQREIIAPSLGGWKTPIVGGFAQITSVFAGGRIETRILARWPDVIGKSIAA